MDTPTATFGTQRLALKGCEVEVTAQPTSCARLVITPAVGLRNDNGEPTLLGEKLGLVHTLSGRTVSTHYRADRLLELASQLAGLDWEFTDPQHLESHPEKKQAAIDVLREFQMSEAYDGPVFYSGEPEEMRAARASDPATTLLKEHLDDWLGASKAHFEKGLPDKANAAENAAYFARIVASCSGYGLIYLLAVLRAIDPKVAGIAARDLVAQYDAGDSMGEWVHQWREELAAGKPLRLRGIPSRDPLPAAVERNFEPLVEVMMYQARCTNCGYVIDDYGDFSCMDDDSVVCAARDSGWFERTHTEPSPRPDNPNAVIVHTDELLCPDCQTCDVCGAKQNDGSTRWCYRY